MVPVIRIDNQVLEELKKEAIHLGQIFGTPNEVLRAILGLDVHENTLVDEVVGKVIEIKVWPAYIRYKYIGIRKEYQHLFPDFGTKVELTTDKGDMFPMKVYNNSGSMELWDLDGWFGKNPHLKVDDIILITTIEPMKKYRLEIVKR